MARAKKGSIPLEVPARRLIVPVGATQVTEALRKVAKPCSSQILP